MRYRLDLDRLLLDFFFKDVNICQERNFFFLSLEIEALKALYSKIITEEKESSDCFYPITTTVVQQQLHKLFEIFHAQ
jgi:hypothetical protein